MWSHTVTRYHQDVGFSPQDQGMLSIKRTWPPQVSCGAHGRDRGGSAKSQGSSMAEVGVAAL